MGTAHIRWVKIKRWQVCWWSFIAKALFAPLADANARIEFIAFLIVVYLHKGYEIWIEKVNAELGTFKNLAVAYVVYVLFSAITAIYKTSRKLSESGQWHGKQFIYHEPQRVFTVPVNEADNNTTHVFKLIDPEIGSLVQTKVEIDALHGRVQARVVWPKAQTVLSWDGWHAGIRTSLMLPDDRLLGLRTNTLPGTDVTVVRVYVTSWSL